jgi:hypothetical protein
MVFGLRIRPFGSAKAANRHGKIGKNPGWYRPIAGDRRLYRTIPAKIAATFLLPSTLK